MTFEITPALDGQRVLFDFMGPGYISRNRILPNSMASPSPSAPIQPKRVDRSEGCPDHGNRNGAKGQKIGNDKTGS
jgi:hypothetical protein